MSQANEFRSGLERKIRTEAKFGWDKIRKQWAKPLSERVLACRAIGFLSISSIEIMRNVKLVHFHPSVDDMAIFREGDRVRKELTAAKHLKKSMSSNLTRRPDPVLDACCETEKPDPIHGEA